MQQHVPSDPGDSGSIGRGSDTQSTASAAELLGPGAAAAAARWRRRPDDRLKRAVRRVLIALSFKANKGRSRSSEPGSKQLQQQQQQQSLQLSSWQLIPGTGLPPANYWDPVRHPCVNRTESYRCGVWCNGWGVGLMIGSSLVHLPAVNCRDQ